MKGELLVQRQGKSVVPRVLLASHINTPAVSESWLPRPVAGSKSRWQPASHSAGTGAAVQIAVS